MKSAIIVDSTAYLTDDLAQHPDVYQVNLSVTFEDGTVMVDSTAPPSRQAFFDKLSQVKTLPTTSQPQVQQYYDIFDHLVAQDYEAVYLIHLSAAISGTFQTAQMVAREYQDRITAYCFDSKSVVAVMAELVRVCLDLKASDRSHAQVAEDLQWIIDRSQLYIMVADLNNLVKGGRLSATGAVVGSMLQIKPFIVFNEAGSLQVIDKIRTNKKVYKRWIEEINQAKALYPAGIQTGFNQVEVPEQAAEAIETIQAAHPDVALAPTVIGGAIATHIGLGAMALAILPKIENKSV